MELTVIDRGTARGDRRRSGRRGGDCGYECLRGGRGRCRPLLGRPCLGLDRGDARGVQALLMPEARHEAAARGGGRGEPGDPLLGRGCDGVQFHRLFSEPGGDDGELFPRVACLFDDPVVLARDAAEAVEPGECFVEGLGAQQERERVALIRTFVERPNEHCELGLGDVNCVLGDVELLRRGGPVLRDLRPPGGEGIEIALCAPELALERIELEGRRARASVERADARTQPGSLRTRGGGVRGERDRNGRQQGKTRQDGHEARRAPR